MKEVDTYVYSTSCTPSHEGNRGDEFQAALYTSGMKFIVNLYDSCISAVYQIYCTVVTFEVHVHV